MYLNPFDGPRAKVERARRHLAELIGMENAYRATQPVSWSFRIDGDDRPKLYYKLERMPPPEAATITSDIIGNLRSSLDLAVCAAAQFDGATNLKNTYFHMAQTKAEWETSFKGRTKASPARIVALNRALEPWQGGNDLLYALNRLAATDKHQILVPIGSTSGEGSVDGIKVGTGKGLNRVQGQIPWFTHVGQEIATMTFEPHSGANVTGPVNITAGLAFGQVDIVSRQPVAGITNKLCRLCSEIIDLVERATRQSA